MVAAMTQSKKQAETKRSFQPAYSSPLGDDWKPLQSRGNLFHQPIQIFEFKIYDPLKV